MNVSHTRAIHFKCSKDHVTFHISGHISVKAAASQLELEYSTVGKTIDRKMSEVVLQEMDENHTFIRKIRCRQNSLVIF